MVRSDGGVIIGPVVSLTVKVAVAAPVAPAESVALKVTVVAPKGKVDGASVVTDKVPSSESNAVASSRNAEIVELLADMPCVLTASTTRSDGALITGALFILKFNATDDAENSCPAAVPAEEKLIVLPLKSLAAINGTL